MPRVFKKKSRKELGSDHHANEKVCMTRILSFDCLKRFDCFIDMKNVKKMLLLLGNFLAHGNNDVLPSIRNVTVRFLPPSAISHILPCDAGMLACVKRLYKNHLLKRVLDNIGRNCSDIYSENILTALQWVTGFWEEVHVEMIKTCWTHFLSKTPRFCKCRNLNRLSLILPHISDPAIELRFILPTQSTTRGLLYGKSRLDKFRWRSLQKYGSKWDLKRWGIRIIDRALQQGKS